MGDFRFSSLRLRFRDGERRDAVLRESGRVGALSADLRADGEGIGLTLAPEGEATLESVSALFDFTFRPDDRLFLNGYQSWTDSYERTAGERIRPLGALPRMLDGRFGFSAYWDYRFTKTERRRGRLHGFSYAYVRRGAEWILFGSLAEDSGFTVIRFHTDRNCILFEKECAGRRLTAPYRALSVRVYRGAEDEVFDAWFSDLGIPKTERRRVDGYTSWYNRYQNISEESVTEDLAGFAAQSEKPDFFQIDDGYQTAVGDWLSVDGEKFPRGMAPIAERIRAAGMKPGIWLAPFAAERTSRLVAEHPDWLLCGEDGKPVFAGGNWSGFYALDIDRPEVVSYLERVFSAVIHDWGYRLLKLDFLYAACLVPAPDATRGERMKKAVDLLLRLTEGAEILACGVPLASVFGKVAYCRIGCDVALSFDGEFYLRPMHRERPSTKFSLLNTLYRRQLNGRAFLSDPDVFLLRDDNMKMTPEERKTLLTLNALCGGVLFTSDNVGAYSDEKKRLLREAKKLTPADLLSVEREKKTVTVSYTGGTLTLKL